MWCSYQLLGNILLRGFSFQVTYTVPRPTCAVGRVSSSRSSLGSGSVAAQKRSTERIFGVGRFINPVPHNLQKKQLFAPKICKFRFMQCNAMQ